MAVPDSATRTRSLVHGSDQDCIRDLITLHATPNPIILDATYGYGRMWKGLAWQPAERMDIRELPDVTQIGDFRQMPADWADRFDVIVYDPPHMAETGANSRHAEAFGRLPDLQHAADITHLFLPFLREARRVLKPQGIILAKLIDTVHRGKMKWQVADFILATRQVAGLTACDRMIKDDPRASTLTGHNWQIQRHLRRNDVFWVVVRKGQCFRR